MRITALVLPATFILFSCSYLPEDGSVRTFLRADGGDFALYYSGKAIPGKSFLMVPGGLVDPFVYECWINRLVAADSTVAVVLLKYPSNLAIANPGKVMRIINDHPEFEQWVIGGHSLGGVVAASVVHKNTDVFDGLVLLGSWSREASDLSGWAKPVLSMYGSEDQLATEKELFDNSDYLPPVLRISTPEELAGASGHTAYYEIAGGNHAGFGCYGPQKGDGVATIESTEQQELMVEMLLSFFDLVW